MANSNNTKSLAEIVGKSITKVAEPVNDTSVLATAKQEIEAIESVTGYMARAMILATLPHRKLPDDVIVYKKQNGDYSLSLLANPEYGLPYGTIPRMLMSFVTAEAVRTQDPTIVLGETLADFMNKLGYVASWGKRGMVKQLKEQAKRLFTTGISCTYENPNRGRTIHQVYIASDFSEWWLPFEPNQRTLWESKIVLSHEFFKEIINRPVPISLETLANLRKSPLALDIYFWLTHRNFGHSSIGHIGLASLQRQFGTGYPLTDQGRRNFKKKFLQALKKVSETYAEAEKLRFDHDVLVVPPGRPDVAHNPAHKGIKIPTVTNTPVSTALQETDKYTAPAELTDVQKAENCWNMKESIREHNQKPNTFPLPNVCCPQLGETTNDLKCSVCIHNPNKTID